MPSLINYNGEPQVTVWFICVAITCIILNIEKGRKGRKNQPTERFKGDHLRGARGGVMIQILELILKTLFQGKTMRLIQFFLIGVEYPFENQ